MSTVKKTYQCLGVSTSKKYNRCTRPLEREGYCSTHKTQESKNYKHQHDHTLECLLEEKQSTNRDIFLDFFLRYKGLDLTKMTNTFQKIRDFCNKNTINLENMIDVYRNFKVDKFKDLKKINM